MSTDCDITLTVSLNSPANQSALDEMAVQNEESFTDEEALAGTKESEEEGFSSESSFESEPQETIDSSDENADLENRTSENGLAEDFY